MTELIDVDAILDRLAPAAREPEMHPFYARLHREVSRVKPEHYGAFDIQAASLIKNYTNMLRTHGNRVTAVPSFSPTFPAN